MADKLMYIPNNDTQNTPAALAEWYTNILGMSVSQVIIRLISAGLEPVLSHTIRIVSAESCL